MVRGVKTVLDLLIIEAPEFVREGGVVMVLLLVCSVFALAVCLERAWALRRSAVLPGRLLQAAEGVRSRPDAEALSARMASFGGAPLASVLSAVLSNLDKPREESEEAMVMAGRGAAARLERGLFWIEIVAATAPLLGLLGTVLGMVEVFGVISVEGVGEAQSFSTGIKKALYTTVAGLSIGIPCLALFIYYSRRAERLAVEMETAATRLLRTLYPSRQRAPDGTTRDGRTAVPLEPRRADDEDSGGDA